MEATGKNEQKNHQFIEVKTFPIPFALKEIKDNISISTNTPNKSSKNQIFNQAFKFHSEGNLLEAAKYYRKLIDQGFNDDKVFCNYGSILRNLGNLKEAELFQRKAIELNPKEAIAYSNLGNILRELGQLHEAKIMARKAIKLRPNFADAHSNLGYILRELGQLQEAEIMARKAIKLKPDFANAHCNLGTILKDLGNLKEAELSQRKAIELNPNEEMAYSNLGNILRELGQLQEAEIMLRKAIKLKPHFADAYLNLSLIELLKGNYKSGLINYDFRDLSTTLILPHVNPKITRLVEGKLEKSNKLLVISEQGLGDTLQFMRYIPYLKDKGIDVSFCAQEKLHSLIKSSSIDKNPLTPEQSDLFSEGYWIPLLSIPRYLQINPESPIISSPYIFSTNKFVKKWKNILSKESKPIIGINWQGNPKLEKTYQGRSIPLEMFSILPQNNDIKILSLQKGFGSEQLKNCSFKKKFIECQPQIDSTWDFLENAAIIENCDLIITCDTSIAHLAGGMGKKVWLLLRNIPFWTWGLEGESTFWYPTMRLFRQKERQNWKEVMERVSSAIEEEIKIKV